jgi:hypothetical protein
MAVFAMTRLLRSPILPLLVSFVLPLAATPSRAQFETQGTTVRRGPDGCTIYITLQIAVLGTDQDVLAIRSALEDSFNSVLPAVQCPFPYQGSCSITTYLFIRKKSDLTAEQQAKCHWITVIPEDGHPSWVSSLGIPNTLPNRTGLWRRGSDAIHRAIYVHEALHLLGLDDHYCDMTKNSPNDPVPVEVRSCPNGPSPCNCTIPPKKVRCTAPCTGHENDIMGTIPGQISSAHFAEVAGLAGLNNCPVLPCCHLTGDVPRDSTGFGGIPGHFALYVAGANPFDARTGLKLRLDVPAPAAYVTVEVYDLLGRRVAVLANEMLDPGTHPIVWSGLGVQRLPAGVYLAVLRAGTVRQTVGVVLTK